MKIMMIQNPKFWAMIEESRKTDETLTVDQVRARIAKRAAQESAASTKPSTAPRREIARRRVR